MNNVVPALVAMTLIGACSLPSRVPVSAPAATLTVVAATATPTTTDTPVPPTAIPPTSTPVSPTITVDTVTRLSSFLSFGQGETLRALAFSPDGSVLASAAGNTEDFAIRLWDVATGLPLGALQAHTAIVWGLAFSPDGQMLASASSDRTARLWDWRNGSGLETLPFPNEVVSVAFSPDGQTLAVGGVDEWPNAAVWTYAVGSWEQRMKLEESWNIPALVYSPDGQFLVGGGTSRNVRVWRTSDGARLFTLYHSGQVTSLAISPDGSTIASGLCDVSDANLQCTRGAVWLWGLHTGASIDRLADFPDSVQGVAFSVDGSVLIAGSRDGTLRFYATSDLRPIASASSPGGVGALAISPDGRFLATGGSNGEIHLWRVEP